jgi:CrcB protein
MTVWMIVIVAGAGGMGAVCRFLLSGLVGRHATDAFPWATFAINVSGSLLVGFAAGLASVNLIPPEWRVVVGTGFLGGYTTFSTFSTDAVALIRSRRPGKATIYSLGMLVASLGAAAAGLLVAQVL